MLTIRLLLGLGGGDLLRQMKESQLKGIELIPQLEHFKTAQEQLLNVPIFTYSGSYEHLRCIAKKIASPDGIYRMDMKVPVSIRGMILERQRG